MAGEAKTTNFMLGTASVMFGPTDEVFDLLPATHGVGLVKNVTVTSEPAYTDLTQGVKNSLVYSVMTQNTVRAQMEVYEYTPANLNYAVGLDGSGLSFTAALGALASPVSANDTDITLGAGEGTNFAVDDWILITDGNKDKVYPRKVTAVVTDTLTVHMALPNAIAAGAEVKKSQIVEVGSKTEQPFLGCKIVGTLADGEQVGLIFPKVRITKGFNIAFSSDNFGNMPFELTMYDLVSTDTLYSQFQNSLGYAVI